MGSSLPQQVHGKLIPGGLLALSPLPQWGARGCSCSTSQAMAPPVTFFWVRTSLAHLGLSCRGTGTSRV